MKDPHWYYERDTEQVGPFTLDDLDRLLKAGLITPDTRLFDSTGRGVRASEVHQIQEPEVVAAAVIQEDFPAPSNSTAILPPPPPPAPPRQTSNVEKAVWDPRVIGLFGILLSPIWCGIMAAINAKRLGQDYLIGPPILVAIGALILDTAIALIFGRYLMVDLVLYFGTLFLIWNVFLLPQLEYYQSSDTIRQDAIEWVVPVLLGTPAMLVVLILFVVYPLVQLSSVQESGIATDAYASEWEPANESKESPLFPSRSPWAIGQFLGEKLGWRGCLALVIAIFGVPKLIRELRKWR